jgi:hypothetical protein
MSRDVEKELPAPRRHDRGDGRRKSACVTRLLNAGLIALCVVLAAELLLGPRFGPHAGSQRPPTPLEHFRAVIDGNYHDCVPLGWYPEPFRGGGYYPSVNFDVAQSTGPFQALWVGIVTAGAERDPRGASVKRVMDELVTAGLLQRGDDPRGTRYNVTRYGERFYYDDDALGGNRERWPYLCYSRLRVTKVVWDTRYPDVPGPDHSTARHILVWWRTETDGHWASAFLRAHSVRLTPLASPADGIVCHYVDDEWLLLSVSEGGAPPRSIPETRSPARSRSGGGTPSAKPRSLALC